ncbi:MAG: DUF4276 family protein [Planctomycetes bacterium]|nr:DUF4276 family protein [Planctomycetota bacterium]
MFAILAEDISDAEVLTHLVRRRLDDESISIKRKGYDGCAKLRRKGALDIRAFAQRGATRIIVCHDADQNDPIELRKTILEEVVRPSQFAHLVCVAIPVEEIEAWIIADESAINKIIPSFRFKGHSNPESINSPKEWLRDKSRAANGKPLYAPKVFNPSVAKHLQFDVVEKKCPSFKSFLAWLDNP